MSEQLGQHLKKWLCRQLNQQLIIQSTVAPPVGPAVAPPDGVAVAPPDGLGVTPPVWSEAEPPDGLRVWSTVEPVATI